MADSESRHMLIEEMMTPKHDGVSPVLSMMKDQFASKWPVHRTWLSDPISLF